MVFKNGVKNIQAVAYNGAVIDIDTTEVMLLYIRFNSFFCSKQNLSALIFVTKADMYIVWPLGFQSVS